MGVRDLDAWMPTLVRHQWVREHGTPRVTTLVGRNDTAVGAWREWLRLTTRKHERRLLFEQPTVATAAWLTKAATRATEVATRTPREPVAIVADDQLLASWLASRDDRLAAFISEGVVTIHSAARPRGVARRGDGRELQLAKARSLAELTLFEALEATPATAARFRLNESVSFHFGSRAAEVDLLSRADELAIEVDGYHHFSDPDHYRRDRRKDLLLQAHGYVVLRFLADDILADPRDAVRTVVELLGVRRGREKARRSP